MDVLKSIKETILAIVCIYVFICLHVGPGSILKSIDRALHEHDRPFKLMIQDCQESGERSNEIKEVLRYESEKDSM